MYIGRPVDAKGALKRNEETFLSCVDSLFLPLIDFRSTSESWLLAAALVK